MYFKTQKYILFIWNFVISPSIWMPFFSLLSILSTRFLRNSEWILVLMSARPLMYLRQKMQVLARTCWSRMAEHPLIPFSTLACHHADKNYGKINVCLVTVTEKVFEETGLKELKRTTLQNFLWSKVGYTGSLRKHETYRFLYFVYTLL